MDYPKAPVLLGQLIGLGAASGALQLDVLPKLLEGDFGVEAKRDLAAAAFKALQVGMLGASSYTWGNHYVNGRVAVKLNLTDGVEPNHALLAAGCRRLRVGRQAF